MYVFVRVYVCMCADTCVVGTYMSDDQLYCMYVYVHISIYTSILCCFNSTVYCTSLLTAHKLDSRSIQTDHNPYFYVNVADIETLNCTRTYIACMLTIIVYSLCVICIDDIDRWGKLSKFGEPSVIYLNKNYPTLLIPSDRIYIHPPNAS